jgi:hypothetical protein
MDFVAQYLPPMTSRLEVAGKRHELVLKGKPGVNPNP